MIFDFFFLFLGKVKGGWGIHIVASGEGGQ